MTPAGQRIDLENRVWLQREGPAVARTRRPVPSCPFEVSTYCTHRPTSLRKCIQEHISPH